MEIIKEMMNHYVDKTDGASIEKKESSIVFHYGEADPQFSNIIVRELAKQIDIMISNGHWIQKVQGKTYLEVKPQELTKVIIKYSNSCSHYF